MRRQMRTPAAGAAAFVVAVALVACTGDDDAEAPPVSPPLIGTDAAVESAPASLPPAEGTADGVLRIGVLMPLASTSGSPIGLPAVSAADYAVEQINQNGGFQGKNVELVRRDEGASAATATVAINELLSEGVDAVVGPGSSLVALDTLDQLMSSGVLTCSPTASSLLLDDYPNRDLFFRTIASDSLQMAAISNVAELTGRDSAVIVYAADLYGQSLADALQVSLSARKIGVAEAIPFGSTDEDLLPQVEALAEHTNSTIVVLASASEGMRMLAAISSNVALLGGEEALPDILVNDAIRPDDPADYLALGATMLSRMQRFGPVVGRPPDRNTEAAAAATTSTTGPTPIGSDGPGSSIAELDSDPLVPGPLPEGPFALNTVDCINLITLSAVAAESDDGAAVAAVMNETAAGGAACRSYAACIELIDRSAPLNIDYKGVNPEPQGEIFNFLADRGDVARGVIMAYKIDPASGRDREEGGTIITAPV